MLNIEINRVFSETSDYDNKVLLVEVGHEPEKMYSSSVGWVLTAAPHTRIA
ncbi:hypothetical protein NQ317_010402 [Molorchus minor]|uniref:Uncharacterized protein n=1 Tax=Molorchus minor TaxID=1323400 RepID=A0ABQ9ITM0_9CUCU|nr:hypothetical protein NQ317_010402 [Molorchus minor]